MSQSPWAWKAVQGDLLIPRSTGATASPDRCDADPEGVRVMNVEATEILPKQQPLETFSLSSSHQIGSSLTRMGKHPAKASSSTESANLYGQMKFDGEEDVLGDNKMACFGVKVLTLYGDIKKTTESDFNVLLEVGGK